MCAFCPNARILFERENLKICATEAKKPLSGLEKSEILSPHCFWIKAANLVEVPTYLPDRFHKLCELCLRGREFFPFKCFTKMSHGFTCQYARIQMPVLIIPNISFSYAEA